MTREGRGDVAEGGFGGLKRIKSALPAPVKRILRDPLMAIAPKRTAYRRLQAAVPAEPVTFSEKVMHKMAFDRRPILRTFADKVAVREYVADRVGTEVLPHVYGVYEDATQIDWTELPREFVLKASHGSGAVAVIWEGAARGRQPLPDQRADWRWRGTIHPDDLDRVQMARLAAGWLQLSYELPSMRPEWAYGGIPPRLIAEELLLDANGRLPNDYKFHVFDGECAAIQVHSDRYLDHQTQWLSRDWKRMDGRLLEVPEHLGEIPVPLNLPRMLELAQGLGQGIDFIRVDLYDLGDRCVFGELTNYPYAATVTFDPPEFDTYLGSAWTLPTTERA